MADKRKEQILGDDKFYKVDIDAINQSIKSKQKAQPMNLRREIPKDSIIDELDDEMQVPNELEHIYEGRREDVDLACNMSDHEFLNKSTNRKRGSMIAMP